MSNQKKIKKREYKSFWDGSGCFGSPLDEHHPSSYKKRSKDPRYDDVGYKRIWPCYVYDKHGKLLRIEHPEEKPLEWIGHR